jgi:hypothetical protein
MASPVDASVPVDEAAYQDQADRESRICFQILEDFVSQVQTQRKTRVLQSMNATLPEAFHSAPFESLGETFHHTIRLQYSRVKEEDGKIREHGLVFMTLSKPARDGYRDVKPAIQQTFVDDDGFRHAKRDLQRIYEANLGWFLWGKPDETNEFAPKPRQFMA